ncbi:hypothetical protein [Cellulomonas fengjieae]|nr:hypothetical protein [Cellulomonas fengjieae]
MQLRTLCRRQQEIVSRLAVGEITNYRKNPVCEFCVGRVGESLD